MFVFASVVLGFIAAAALASPLSISNETWTPLTSMNLTLTSEPISNDTLISPLYINGSLTSVPVSNDTLASGPMLNNTLTPASASNSTWTPLPFTNGTITSVPISNDTLAPDPIRNGTLTSGMHSNYTLPPIPVFNTTLPPIPSAKNNTLTPLPMANDSITGVPTPNMTLTPEPTSSSTLILCNDFDLREPCSYNPLPDFDSNCTHVSRTHWSPDSTKFSFISSLQMPVGYICRFYSGIAGCIDNGSIPVLRLVGPGYHDCRPDWDNQITFFDCVPV